MAETRFAKVRCPDCENEQVLFLRAASMVTCQVCGATLAEPT
ncbi:MAG: 30S ribosomal protein S27e, partial [Thermoplasmata archaeon]|nr:30S ribosomal protein S27e [Thermoplasmata archaeon]